MAEEPQVDWRLVVEQIRRNDPAGEEILYRQLNAGARLFFQRRLGTRDVDDYVHEVFLIVIQAIRGDTLREPERLMGFVRTVLQRQLDLAISRLMGARERASATDTASQLNSGEPDPEQVLLERERVATMKRGLKSMKEKDVEILTRYYIRGQKQDQICQEMTLTPTQFTLRKSRAKARLTTWIQRTGKRFGA